MRVRELLSLPAPGAKKTVVKPVVEAKPVEVVTATQVEEKKPKPAVTVEPKVEEKNTVAETKSNIVVVESGEPVDYVSAEIQERPVATVAEFAATSKKNEIVAVINEIVTVEAPILKDTLMRKVFSVFGVNKTNVTAEAFEKALKAADTKNAKLKGIVFCWKKDQEPNDYAGIRVSNDRAGEEIAPQEIRNAICYVLKSKGCLTKDELIKETSLLFGYKRLGKNLEAALIAGMQWAKSSGAITSVGGNKFELAAETVADTVVEMKSVDAEPLVAATSEKKSVDVHFVIPEGATPLYCEGGNYKAAAVQAGVNFVVLKGSKINDQTTPSCPDTVIKTREKHADSIDADFVMGEDISFSSPSGAAAFVAGASRNGYTEWHTEDGTLLKDMK